MLLLVDLLAQIVAVFVVVVGLVVLASLVLLLVLAGHHHLIVIFIIIIVFAEHRLSALGRRALQADDDDLRRWRVRSQATSPRQLRGAAGVLSVQSGDVYRHPAPGRQLKLRQPIELAGRPELPHDTLLGATVIAYST